MLQRRETYEQSHEEFLLQYAERLLIQLTFQLPFFINMYNVYPSSCEESSVHSIPILFQYFEKFKQFLNPTFFDVLSIFLDLLQFQWENIFYGNSVFLREHALIIFNMVHKLALCEQNNENHYIFSFMVNTFSKMIEKYTDFQITTMIISEIQLQFTNIIDFTTDKNKMLMNQLIQTFLQELPTVIHNYSAAMNNLRNCVSLFYKCSQYLNSDDINKTFQSIMDYVIWIISKFIESKKFSPYPFREIPKIELTGIGVPFYKNHAYCLPDESFETLNEKFASIPETLSKIIQSQDEKSSFFRLIENVLLSIPDRKSYISNENIQQDNDVLDSEKNNMKSHFFTLLSFILELINHFNTETVYDLIFADLNHFKEIWAPKIIDYLYPADKSYVNQALQDLFGILFYKCYLHLEKNRKFLLDELSFVIDSRTTQTYLQTKPYMDQFLPLLNTILIKTDTKFGSIVVSSQLFKTLIRESKIDVRVFDLFSTIIYAYPIECFTTSLLTSFFIETYDHDLFYNSIVRCLANGLHNLCQVKDQNESRYLFNHFISILPALFSKRSERCHDLIDMLTRTVLSFENSMFIMFFSSGILEVITRQCISLKTETMLRSTFTLFTAISQQNPKNLKLMSNPKAPIFNLFSEFFTRNAFDFEIVDALFEFAIVPSPDMTKNKSFDYKDYSSDHYFRNPMAVSLIFYWIQGRKNESEIIQLLIVMIDRHSVNAYQLQKAHVPLMILTRLKKVSNDNNLAQDYCDLLYTIWRQGAPVSDIFRAISIMKTIDSPHLIIDNFNRLLRQEKKNHAVSFWFDGKDSGFSGPKFDFEKTFDTLCISLSFYSDYLPINDTYPLLFFKNEKADRIEFGLTQNNIYFSLNDKGQQLFKTCFLKGVWYNVAFIINPKGIKLIVDNSKGSLQIKRNVYRDSIFRKVVDSNRALTDPEVFTANFQITQSIKMFIGRKSNHTAFFKGLIGTVYVFNEYIPNEDYAHIDPLTISSALKEHLIGIYNPRINIENNKYYLNDNLYSEYVGMTFQSYKTIHSVFNKTNMFDCLIPLHQRLSSCPECSGTTTKCVKCGRLNQETGKKLFTSLTSFIEKLLRNSKVTENNRSTKNIIIILSQLYNKIDSIFFSNELIKSFFTLFDYAQSASSSGFQININRKIDMGQQMVESIWLNYEMISKFPVDMQIQYFSIHLMKALTEDEKHQKLFQSFASYDFLIHKLLLFFTHQMSDITKIAWQMTFECLVKRSLTTATASALLSLAFAPEAVNVSDAILSFIEELVKTGQSTMIAATQAFNSLVPYAIWASRPPLSTQKKAIDILKNSVSTMKEEAITAIYYAALLYESPSHGNDIFPLITKLLDEGLSFFYPFFVRSVRNMSKDDYDKNSKTIVNYLIPGKCHDPDNFYYWILLIAEQSIELRTSSIDFGEIIGQLICKDFSAKKFDSLDQLMNLIILFNHELETDLTPIGTSTIEYLFAYIKRKKEKGAEILTPIFCSCFTLFFFSPNPKSEPPEDNVFTQYSDHFCFFTKKLKFDCILNQQIPQSFISIARTFIKYQAKKPFNIQLAENAPLISYVELQAFTLLKLQNCGESLTDFNKKCISVLKKQSKTEVVLGLLKSINDSNASSIKCDNAEQILNTFESTLQNICTFSYTTQLQANCDNFIQQFMTKIVKSLDFTLTSLPAPESSSMEYFISAVNSSSLKKLLLMYKKYRQNITDKYNTTQAINEKILTVFNRELGTQCGPWYHSDSQNGKHFKSAKTFVSPYSLSNMKINPKFDIIKPCSSIEDRLRPLPVNPDKTIYNAKLITLRFVFTGIIHSMPNGLVFTGEYTNIKKRRLDILSKEIIYIFTRTIINGAEGCEIFLNNSKAYLFEFPPGVRDNLFKFIEENYKIKRYAFFGTKYNFFSSIVKASGGVIQKVSSDELYTQSKLSEAWETRKITTFTYLYYLNILAGRSFNDLCKYPIFPWVISDYNADELDILKMEIFRDLTRPIPFLKASRTDPKQSIHISNSNIVLNYLQRLEPYSSIRSNFQIDQSKCPPFDSILDTWNSIMNCPNDNRELIPEFYCNPLIFKSEKGDVALPKWAKNSPYIFVKGNRAALESEIVRKSLHKWIDMIFGIHLNALDVVANNPDLKPAYFGVLPQQILLQPQHPSCEPISYQFDENYKLPIKKVHRIRQGIVLTDDFKIVTSDGTKIKSPRITNLKFFEVSKQAKIAFYGSSFESYVNAVFFKDQEHVIMSHEAALVNSIAVVGLYLVTGTVEGTINRWRLPKLKTFPLLKTNFHRCPVVAIGGSVSMNTIVSLDIEGRLVYETLLYHGFLLTVKLKHSFPTNYIVVYKSGNVIVIQSSKNKSIISVLDMTGNIIKVREYSAFIQEYDKMYSTEKSDLLIIGYNSDTVEILDIPSLITIREYHGMIPNMRFSKAGKSKKHIKAFIASEIAILPMDVATKKI